MSQEPVQAPEDQPIAYSYVRFSTAKQVLGDSLRRQVDMARDYCEKHGLRLHEDSYRDLGVSAFKRANVEKGALAAFIAAVKEGKVPKGSYLVVEQFDRLSRDDVDMAVKLLLDLVHNDVRVVTLVDQRVWDRAAVKDMGNLMLAIALMSRANNESAMKAMRLREKWGVKKSGAAAGTNKLIVTSECPRWLAPNADKTGFVVLEDRVESIRRVFELRIAGRGIPSITSQANREKWPVPGKLPKKLPDEDDEAHKARAAAEMTWHTSLVGRLLRNRALLGEYQPHKNTEDGRRKPQGDPIPDYYPAVLDETTFMRAQGVAERHGKFPGRRDASYKNWLQGLLRCSCGKSMVRKNKNSEAQPGYARYYCSARNRGVTKCPGANAGQLELAVLHVVSTVAPNYFDGSARMESVNVELDVLEVELRVAKDKQARFAEAIGDSKAPPKSLLPLLVAAEAEVERVEARMRSLRAEKSDLEGDFDSVFDNIAKQAESLNNLDDRAKLREELSRVIKVVEVHEPAGYIRVFLRSDDEEPIEQVIRPDGKLPGLDDTP